MSMAEEARSRLGRGLAALIGDMGSETQVIDRGRGQRRVPIEFLKPNPKNPRRLFSEAELDELAASIKERGIIQPIVVRPAKGQANSFEIIAGERRWRAAQRAGVHEVPVVTLEATDEESLELAIIENVQRSDLNPLEEAGGYQTLMDQFKHSQDDVAKIVGKSRPHVANTLRLLKLSEPIKAYINAGKLSAGHARMLVGQPNADELAKQIVEQGLNVRQVEDLARTEGQKPAQKKKKAKGHAGRKDPNTADLERRVSDALGLTVKIDHRGEAGVIQIKYRDLDQLDAVVRKLEGK
jgi:ParB family chromosome partitioning protein